MKSVRREMVKIYREGRNGSMDTSDMTRFTFVLQCIAKVIETSELEQRLGQLESIVALQQSQNGNGGRHVY